MSVDRFGMGYRTEPDADKQGEWVRYDDYANLERELTAYQIAKDNLELRLSKSEGDRMLYTHPSWQVY